MIRQLVFDFGGVLIDWNPRYIYKDYFDSQERMEWFLQRVATPEWNGQMDVGRTFAECVAELQEQYPEWAEAIALYQTRWHGMIGGEVDGMAHLLEQLHAAGVPLYGLTNWSTETLPAVMARFSLFRHFRGIVVSGEERVAKPDQRIYTTLLKRYALRPDECLFIDDNAANVAGAQRVGMQALRFTDAAALRAQLSEKLGLSLEP